MAACRGGARRVSLEYRLFLETQFTASGPLDRYFMVNCLARCVHSICLSLVNGNNYNYDSAPGPADIYIYIYEYNEYG